MTDKLRTIEERNFSTDDDVLRALTGKVAESGSALKENTEQLKKVQETTSRLPAIEKQLGSLEDRVWKMEQSVENRGKDLKEAVGKQGETIDKLATAVSIPVGEIRTLRQDLAKHERLFEKPLHKEIHYRHFLGWPIVAVVLAAVGAVFMFGLWQDASYQLSAKKENDIKYRYMKLSGESVIQKRVDSADQAWLADPEQFKKAVEGDEELLWENTSNYMRKERLDSETRELRKPTRRQ